MATSKKLKSLKNSKMFQHEIHIPKERVAILIGRLGSTRRSIERLTHTKIAVTKDGDVTISSDDNLHVFLTTSIVKAIGRGFNPRIASSLWSEDKHLEIVSIRSIIGESEKKMLRVRARLIGSEGRARKNLERLTNTEISIYGKTVAIIGRYEDVAIARQAVDKLIHGSKHGNVYKFIERHKNRIY